MDHLLPFAHFAPPISSASPLRQAITAACRRPEPACVADLLPAATMLPELRSAIALTARRLVTALRAKGPRGGVDGLVKEYALSSQEGVALMCLAEALLRIPDNATRDALIRDKIAQGDWRSHVGQGRSLFVNAATWGLVVTGKLVGRHGEPGLAAALTRLIARAGEPVIRHGVDTAMALMGEQFVAGETIDEALKRARRMESRGFAYSYDMLGEAATTAEDAARYHAAYCDAIHAIGKASQGRGVWSGPGISIKLSALHPRYSRAQAARVRDELLPRVRELALLARGYDIGLNIDAEEADRLEISLDILENLARDSALGDWQGLGFVVQAYGKRCPGVIDWIVDLARCSGRRIMVRLVKGAYWDSEIKRAQADGLSDFPVFTRKVHTDLSYIACARKLLAARDVVFPQFATHNAQTLATIHHLAGPHFTPGDFEFQCLHGMGEALYEEVVGSAGLNRPCRVYAPVGTHETLLAYLVRRLLENGANSSFVHRIGDEAVSIDELVRDPVDEANSIEPLGSPHPAIALPAAIHGSRRAAAGMDLADESVLHGLGAVLAQSVQVSWQAQPMVAGLEALRVPRPVRNPADHGDEVGAVGFALDRDVALAASNAARAFAAWSQVPVDARAVMLDCAAQALEQRMPDLLGLIVREAGKSLPNAIAEVREAVDFLRYYADQARRTLSVVHAPLGPVVCISPWNFPLAIFTGQIAAALATGNTVLAKPAEETPLIAAEAVRLLHEVGIPCDVLQLLPGDGAVGAALVARAETAGVLFTGSTEVAKLIQRELAGHSAPHGEPIPLVAETGGQNAMIVDSSALAEQVTADVIASAFDSAGQRCSALRILCLQEDVADRQLHMLKGAMAELVVGNPDCLATDVGPVISAEAKAAIDAHIDRMRSMGCRVEQVALPKGAERGTFVAPTLIEIDTIDQIGREVFGPVLHVLRFRRDRLDDLIEAINATGYGLTFGLHTRLDETIDAVSERIDAGNIYINRNVIGAVVGAQPFGGRGLSGTGPKAGGPLYLGRLLRSRPEQSLPGEARADPVIADFARWLEKTGNHAGARLARACEQESPLGHHGELTGPVGESNLYALLPRGKVLLLAETVEGLIGQLAACFATGNRAAVLTTPDVAAAFVSLPPDLAGRITWLADWPLHLDCAAVLLQPGRSGSASTLQRLSRCDGPIPLVQQPDEHGHYRLDWLVEERSVSINTTAAGGNASLMAMV